MRFKPGKLDPDFLVRLLNSVEIADPRVAIGPAVGRDVAAVRLGEGYLVAKTDPITFATDRIGWYVVHVNANDVATVGAHPRWFLVTALLPADSADEEMVQGIWNDLRAALRQVECDLIGGHTEVTHGIDRPILVGQMLAEVPADDLVDKRNVRPGDRVLLTKGVPVEGTTLMARECPERLKGAFSPAELERARAFLDDPGISVVPEALAACSAADVHGMHDPTEGGLATGLWELAEAADCGMVIEEEQIPIVEPGGAFCRELGLDPLGTISSGSLILCVAPQDADAAVAAVQAQGTPCADIGEVRPRQEGCRLRRHDGRLTPMPTFPQDEITRLFS